MNKLAIVYWSGTGNTETMANCIADGARESGAEVAMLSPGEFSAARFSEFGVVAFGCPAMGAEQLEEDEVEPMFAGLEGSLGGKKIALFGSYGWGSGEWMEQWVARCQEAGAVLQSDEGLIVNEVPDDQALDRCRDLGRALASW